MRFRDRRAIATSIIVLVVVLVIAVGVIGAYFAFSGGSASGSTSTTGLTSSSKSTSQSSAQSSVSSAKSTASTLSSSTGGIKSYSGTFVYANPLGPFGINDSSGRPVEWNSTQSASGTFTFSINTANYTGTGRGQGTITVTTQGYCTGSVTIAYTFTIEANDLRGGNITVAFNTPTPSSATVQLTCQGSTVGFSQANNPIAFLSVYPNLVSIRSTPGTVSQLPTAGISYTVTITQTN